jgi:hypothetical protein
LPGGTSDGTKVGKENVAVPGAKELLEQVAREKVGTLQFQPAGPEADVIKPPLETLNVTCALVAAAGPVLVTVTLLANVSPGSTDAGEASDVVKSAGATIVTLVCAGCGVCAAFEHVMVAGKVNVVPRGVVESIPTTKAMNSDSESC